MDSTQCRHFTGYKPCGLNLQCDLNCKHLSIPKHRILVVHLEALGAVLRSTALLPAILRKYPEAHITWVTKAPAGALLENNPHIDRVLTVSAASVAMLQVLNFDVAFVIDKSLEAYSLAHAAHVGKILGFVVDPGSGAILPATSAAEELWSLGLDNHKKFFVNQRPETQLTCEALELAYKRDEYEVHFTKEEQQEIMSKKQIYRQRLPFVIGINTGASPTIAAKKLSVPNHRQLVSKLLSAIPQAEIVLLGGGAEDQKRNEAIAAGFDVIQSPCEKGIRDGLTSVAACDVVITGDSLGMHMAIALKKWVVAWFGPTCAQEIDLYERGVKIRAAVGCSPCWKRTCHKDPMCYDRVDFDSIVVATQQGLQWTAQNQILLSKPLSSETFFSPSPSSEI